MEKYNSNNMSSHKNVFNNNVQIIFDKEDGKCGMKVSLEEIVDVWLERVEPERQQTLELEQKTRSEMRELAILRKDKEKRETEKKRYQVQDMLKPFLAGQILKVLEERDLEITKSNIRSLIGECKISSSFNSQEYKLEPIGRLFTERVWNTFRENCNKIYKNGRDVGMYDQDYTCGTVYDYFITPLKELRDSPISDWK